MKPLNRRYGEAVAARLPSWKKAPWAEEDGAYYRRNQDFVQWLGFQTSVYAEKVVAAYSIQALASQSEWPGSVIYARIMNRSGENWWVTPDEWAVQPITIVEVTIRQIRPDPYAPLSNKEILKITKTSRLKSANEFEMHGITLVVNNQVLAGRKFLEKALSRYEEFVEKWHESWDIDTTNRIKRWLECPNEQLVSLLRLEAEKGAALLSI